MCDCVTLKKVAENIKDDSLSIFCYELGGETIGEISKETKTISIIIGPEGGFTADEAGELSQNGAVVTTLGSRILRTETAPLVALTAIMLRSGNM